LTGYEARALRKFRWLVVSSRGAFVFEVQLPILHPALALFLEGALLGCFESLDGLAVRFEEGIVVGEIELGFFYLECETSSDEVGAHFEESLGADRIKSDLVEEAEQPGLVGNEVLRDAEPVVNL